MPEVPDAGDLVLFDAPGPELGMVERTITTFSDPRWPEFEVLPLTGTDRARRVVPLQRLTSWWKAVNGWDLRRAVGEAIIAEQKKAG